MFLFELLIIFFVNMECYKRLCTKRIKYLGQPVRARVTLQDLPLEVVAEILSYLPLSEIVRWRNLCKALRIGVALRMNDSLRKVRMEVGNRVTRLKSEFVSMILEKRIDESCLFKSLHYWWNVQNDLRLLNVTIWRYKKDVQIWCYLASLIAGIFDRITQNLSALDDSSLNSFTELAIDKFFERFTTEIELHFHRSVTFVPFELRLTDLLFCCPYGNIKMVFNHGDLRTYVYSYITVIGADPEFPRVSEALSKVQNEIEILHFLRQFIKEVNSMHVWMVIERIKGCSWLPEGDESLAEIDKIISLMTSGDESSIANYERTSEKGDREDVYEHRSSIKWGRFILWCFFEIAHSNGKKSKSNGDNTIDKRDKKFLPCVACSYPPINNRFHLGINKDVGSYTVQNVVFYEPEKRNYSFAFTQ